MGTRADFYIGRGESAEWLGSIAWDGYPDGIDGPVLEASTADSFRNAVFNFAATRDDWTAPEQGWPWPWDDSHTTDYAYAFFDGRVWFTGEHGWTDATEHDHYLSDAITFPDMSARKNVTLGKRSGVILFGGA